MQNILPTKRFIKKTYESKRVLVIDDFESMTRTMASILETLEFKAIHRAKDGKEALLKLKTYEIDLVISDWNMPTMNGFELLQYIRENETTAHIPFIMVTGNTDQDDVVTAIMHGVTEYMVKPFSKAMLIDRVHKAFKAPPSKPIKIINDPPIATAANKAPAEPPAQNNILIVDDEPNNLMVLGELLKGEYKIKACRSGEKALEICDKDTPPDLILLDIMMPEMSGLEVCEALKKNPLTEHIPIIFVSALSQTQDVLKGLALGAVDYVTKPVTPEIVAARVKNHMKIVDHRKSLNAQIETLIETTRIRDETDRMLQHDLNNPLTAIMASLPTLEEKAKHCSDEIDLIRESSEMIKKMVSSQSSLNELEEKNYQIQPQTIDANSLIKKLCHGLKSKCEENNIFIRFNVPAAHQYQGDSLLSYTMFSNLINNAIEAAPPGSNVKVSSQLEAEKQNIIFSVHNHGEVPPAIQGKFFEKFVTSGKKGGTGIGTYSARLAAEAQGGNISFKTCSDEGTTIYIEFEQHK